MISNKPIELAHVTYNHSTWDGAYSDEEIKMLVNYFSTMPTENASVETSNSKTKILNSIRTSDISFHEYDNNNDNTKWFFDKTNNLIKVMNDNFYQFDLHGYDYFQYGEYDGNKKSKYDYHLDMRFGWSNDPAVYVQGTRKLSFVLCLSDPSEYEGGNFLINLGPSVIEVPQKKGRMIAFPSFIMHKVSEVTSGKRKSIAIWTTGPKFK